MEKWRAGFDKPYWCMTNKINVLMINDCRYKYDDINYETGNYFKTKEEAESMARKIKAVLNGAEVIEMPSEEEFEMIAELEYPTGTDELLLVNGIKLAQAAFNAGVKWLKSKIK